MTRPLAILVGFMGKIPVAGMSLFNLHYILGLRDLGYDVHYVERQNWPDEYYDPRSNAMTDDVGYALDYLAGLLPAFGLGIERLSFIDQQDRCHGADWPALRNALARAEFVLTLCEPTWFEELDRCPRRAYVDGDPVFTQVRMTEDPDLFALLSNYQILFTYGTRIGAPGSALSTGGRRWIPTRPVVATQVWEMPPPTPYLPVTALLQWRAGKDVAYDGDMYGHKDREVRRFMDFPRRVGRPMVLAVGGRAPRERLSEGGWDIVDPLAATRTIDAYREFIAGSRADFGIAKHAYVRSRCGWFSDRAACFLAASRPVLHQDTGFSDWLPGGDGVLCFSGPDDAQEALHRLDADHDLHVKAARAVAEEHFEAATVIGRMLDDAGFR